MLVTSQEMPSKIILKSLGNPNPGFSIFSGKKREKQRWFFPEKIEKTRFFPRFSVKLRTYRVALGQNLGQSLGQSRAKAGLKAGSWEAWASVGPGLGLDSVGPRGTSKILIHSPG